VQSYRDVFRVGVLHRLGVFNPAFKVAGDFEMCARALSKAPFERVPSYIACYRRTGTNYSAVNRECLERESALICKAFGPHSNLERQYWRYLWKALV
jgi:hypothetical protein